DLDGDGHEDVVSAGTNIIWFQNNGEATPTFTANTISTDSGYAVWVADIDGDTDLDVITGSAIYYNDSAQGFTRQTLSARAVEALYVADANGDTSLDVIIAGNSGVYLYTNDGAASPAFTESTIGTVETDSLYAGDVDGDADLDVFASETYRGEIYWYENDGATSPAFTSQNVSNSLTWVGGVSGGDLDGDGDIDLVAGSRFRGTVQWLENDGLSEPTFTARGIESPNIDVDYIDVVDMEGDGDLDIIASTDTAQVNWYENDGSESPTFTMHDSAANANRIFSGDLTGNGLQELIAAEYGAINWYPTTQRYLMHAENILVVDLTDPASDVDGNTLTYGIASGSDAALFSIDAASGELSFQSAPAFATPVDANGDNVYEVVISVSDGYSTLNRQVAVEVYSP
ncbi:MAG: FG-GAP-like repeat-containing protein, partial [Candidatus Thiodiazotropha sp.]